MNSQELHEEARAYVEGLPSSLDAWNAADVTRAYLAGRVASQASDPCAFLHVATYPSGAVKTRLTFTTTNPFDFPGEDSPRGEVRLCAPLALHPTAEVNRLKEHICNIAEVVTMTENGLEVESFVEMILRPLKGGAPCKKKL